MTHSSQAGLASIRGGIGRDVPFERQKMQELDAIRSERERVEQANEIAGIVFDEHKKAWPDLHPVLDLRYGIADALWDAGYRKGSS